MKKDCRLFNDVDNTKKLFGIKKSNHQYVNQSVKLGMSYVNVLLNNYGVGTKLFRSGKFNKRR
jgi:hypothetical protein